MRRCSIATYVTTTTFVVATILLVQLQSCSSLTVSGPSTGNRPVKRIAIIGSGISGLSVTHALVNNVNRQPTKQPSPHSFEVVDLFDARTGFDHTAGAGIQLNGGLSILGKINPAVQNAVYHAGLPQTKIESRTNPWFRSRPDNHNQHQWYDVLLRLDLQDVVQSAGGDAANFLLQSTPSTTAGADTPRPMPTKKLLWISIMRGALQRALYDSLPSPTNNGNQWRLQFQKKLINIRSSSSSTNDETTLYCQFDDGTESGPYDLIIGCEGINSKVKQFVESNNGMKAFQSTPKRASASTNPADTLDVRSAIYSGLRIRYAVADGDAAQPSPETTAQLTQFFGNGAYALHGTYGAGIDQPNTQCAFIVYLDENYIGPFQRKQIQSTTPTATATATIGENADWTQDQRRTVELARENMLQQLQTCQIPGDDSADDVLRQTIRKADRFFELGSYYHNPFGAWSCTVPSSPSSSSHAHVVLCGDAAHALPPFLGQGSNQAIQDAYCLAEKIVEYNTRIANGDDNVKLQSLLNEYQQIRWQPCFEIFWKAAFLGYLETGGINGFYSKFRDAFFKSMGIIGVASNVLLNAATPKV